jgi:flagellar motor switch protein FliG
VVTFGQFFQLTSELQGRVLEGFGLKDLALLLSQMQESERQPLVAMQSERRREMLLEEMDTLAAATPGWLAIRSRKVKSQVVARMKEMRDRGELEIVTKRGKAAANGSQDASGSDQGKGANAA